MTNPSRDIHALVVRAASDPAFAQQLLNDPESVGTEYNLTSAQIGRIRELAAQGAFRPAAKERAAPAYY
jgi:hypothetical protein